MQYDYDDYDYKPRRRGGLGQRALTGTVIGAIPAIATGNPMWLGYGALGGTALGLLEGRNALGGGLKGGGNCWMGNVGRPTSRRVYGGAQLQPFIIEGGDFPEAALEGGRRKRRSPKSKSPKRKSRSRKVRRSRKSRARK